MRRRAVAAALGLAAAGLAAALALALLSDGGGERAAPPPPAATAPPSLPPQPGPSLAVGLTEMSPALLWSARSGVDVGAFAPWRDRVAALRPRYLRVLVDWAQLQPDPAVPPSFDLPGDGCMRGQPPCRAAGGLREVMRAVRSQQRAGGGFEVVLVLYGVPAWAARPPSGCERPGTEPRSRPLTAPGLEAYRALVRALVALGRQEDVALRWWSPWNEPNGPFFVSPQRARCDPSSPSLAPPLYTTLFRAMRDELRAAGGDRRLLLGELADAVPGRSYSTPVRRFLAALARDVLCGADAVSQHVYAERGDGGDGGDAARRDVVGAIERLLERRGCGEATPIWITETGAGGPHAGAGRTGGAAGARADCRALAALLRRWWADPRVTAAFQYTFRDDPAFPVGLADAGLTHAWPALDLLDAWGGDRDPAAPPPALPASCRA